MARFCSLSSGSSGNAIFIGEGGTKLLVDAGMSAKWIIKALGSIGENPAELSAILVSHEHIDHVRSVGVLSRKFDIPIYANKKTWDVMENMIGPVRDKNKMCFETGLDFSIGGMQARAFSIPHDAAEPVGFNFFIGRKKITIATDIGHVSQKFLRNLEMSDFLMIESNHDIEMLRVGPYPWPLKRRIMSDTGHLSNDAAGETVACLAEKGARRFLLGHLSRENNFPELAYQTVCSALHEKGIGRKDGVMLEVALRDSVSSVFEI